MPSRQADEAFKDLTGQYDRVEVCALIDNLWTVVLWKCSESGSLRIAATAKIHNETGKVTYQ